MSRPTKADLAAAQDATIPDLLPDPLRLLVVGINPSLWSGATGAHYARPGNRFYPALAAAGITPHVVDAAAGWTASDRRLLKDLGLGMTNLVARATARADELSADELREAPARLARLVEEHRPAVVAFLGLTAYRVAFGDKGARAGRQDRTLAGAQVWVLPNPSGLNAHETVATLGAAYREAAVAAGIDVAARRAMGPRACSGSQGAEG